jgi:hypothetical protein
VIGRDLISVTAILLYVGHYDAFADHMRAVRLRHKCRPAKFPNLY